MSLIACPECKKQVSNQASSCPHCGYPINAVQENKSNELMNCPDCHGQGEIMEDCHACHGTGKVVCSGCDGTGGTLYPHWFDECTYCHGTKRETCYDCNGDRYNPISCKTCEGTGQLPRHIVEKMIHK